jgi:hypothetical protein
MTLAPILRGRPAWSGSAIGAHQLNSDRANISDPLSVATDPNVLFPRQVQ